MKINYMGRRVNGRFDSFKAFIRRVVRFTLRLAGTALTIFVAGSVGAMYFSSETITTMPPQVVHAETPVLGRIAMCESHNSQFCTSELVKIGMCKAYEVGQVLHHVNNNGTIDTGVMQINSIHGAEASRLGFNLDIEKDNRAFGQWIYENKGTGDWSASQKCWYR